MMETGVRGVTVNMGSVTVNMGSVRKRCAGVTRALQVGGRDIQDFIHEWNGDIWS